MKLLTLDMSTKTGWSVASIDGDKYTLISYGLLPKVDKPDSKYPEDYVSWARKVFAQIQEKIEETSPDIIVVEETARGSKNNFSQKILEFIHFLFADYVVQKNIPTRYMMTGEWREAVGARMSSSELKQNAKSRKIKEKTGSKLAKDENGKILGRVTKKHVNVRRVNEEFGLSLKIKDNDVADAILLGLAHYMFVVKGFVRNTKK